MSFDAAWDHGQLAHEVCDILVKKGQLKEKPAFIRGDREEKIKQTFVTIGLDGARMATFDNAGPLETCVRRGTNGETWVQQVLEALVGLLPEEVAKASKNMAMDEGVKEEMEAAKERSEQRRQRLAENEEKEREENGGRPPRGGGKGDRNGGYRGERDGEREDRGRGGGNRDGEREDRWGDSGGRPRNNDNMECYNCGGMGHSSRDCPEPRKEKGKGRGKFNKDRTEQQCFNCKQFGHRSRDCPEPPDEELVRQRLAAKAEKEARRERDSD
eukprot:TRINITY_DN144_c0_g1_i1.p1 TRINITY_DN144_c0_g1~~TRINITY_DN144_c0_g1_i1.p1  ORF type:complete len:289 (+),score=70.17 TRINITY_DN144_c0_g1_i1:55-867(+)